LITTHPELVAILAKKSGKVQVRSGKKGKWRLVKEGAILKLGDRVKTGSSALARLEFIEKLVPYLPGATQLDLMSNTQITLENYKIDLSATKRKGIVNFIRGVLHVLTKHWKKGSVFNVNVGTTHTGIRGTDIRIHYDPVAERVLYRLFEGVVSIETPYDKRDLREGYQVSVVAGRIEQTRRIVTAPPL